MATRTSVPIAVFTGILLGAGCVEAPVTRSPDSPTAPTVLTAAQLARDAELIPKATAFLSAYTDTGAHLTRSGAVLFGSNRDGLAQLYVGDESHPGDPPRRLPTPVERVRGVTLTPDEKTVLFASDVSSDGNYAIYRIGLDGSGLLNLTPAVQMHRDSPLVALGVPGLFAYSGHLPASAETTVSLQTIDSTSPREVYADPQGGELADFSPDGKRALFLRILSAQDVVLFEIDVDTGRATRLAPPEGQPAALTAAYTAAADQVLVAYQAEGGHAQVLLLDRKTLRTMARYEEQALPRALISSLGVSPDGDWITIDVDAGNHREVRILDAHSLALRRTVATPVGLNYSGHASADGKRFTIVESRPDLPAEIFAVDARSGTTTPLRSEVRPGLSEMPTPHVSIESITSFDGLAIPTNVYLPADPAHIAKKLPVLVNIHGGPSGSSVVRWNPALTFYISQGYAIVEPNIRGSSGFGPEYQRADNKEKRGDALRDVEAINRWARAQPWCDPDRLTIMGISYGGYMTLLAAGRQPQLWRAGLDVSGMSDLRSMERLEDQAVRVDDEIEFGALGKEDELLFEWSPLKHVDAIVAPLFVYQGVHDHITPQNEADQIVKALRQRHIPVEYMRVENEGHSITRRENNAEYLARTVRFLEEHAGAR